MVHAKNTTRQGHRHRDERGLHRNRHSGDLRRFEHRGSSQLTGVRRTRRVICFRQIVSKISRQRPVIVNFIHPDSCQRKHDFKRRGRYITSGDVTRVIHFKRLFNKQRSAVVNFVHSDNREQLFNEQRPVVVNLSGSDNRKQEHAVASRHQVGARR